MVHAKLPKKITKCFFGRFPIFGEFLPMFEDCKPILTNLDKFQHNEMQNIFLTAKYSITVYPVS